jgi:ADP-ribosylglycohydrolase
MLPTDHEERLARARCSLDGLSVGDAFGERFFQPFDITQMLLERRATPAPPWRWTDDTAMALSVVEILERSGRIVEGDLAEAFARRYREEPERGYGEGARVILAAIARKVPWEKAAGAAFGGQGSKGNGAAMRAAPIGAYFADDLAAVVANASRSAAPTHAHADGAAGAIAVAVAAALAPTHRASSTRTFLRAVAEHVPEGATRDGIAKAAELAPDLEATAAVERLGNGSLVLSADTVPFALYAASRHLGDYEEALWYTVSGLGDRDTTCAIVGGILALTAAVPQEMIENRETLGRRARPAK